MQRGRFAGVAASVAAVALVTAAIALLDNWVPVLSLGVLYLFAVLPIAVVWGTWYAIAVSVGSMLAFNFFFLEPVHTLTIADSRNWFALVVFVAVAVVVSELAARSRRRAREASLLAGIATSLLEHGTVGEELERISAEAARALQVDGARITLGDGGDGFALTAGRRPPRGRDRAPGPRPRRPGRPPAAAPGARFAARRRDRPRAARARGARRRGPPARGRDEDRAPPGGQPRPAHAADGDLDLRGR